MGVIELTVIIKAENSFYHSCKQLEQIVIGAVTCELPSNS